MAAEDRVEEIRARHEATTRPEWRDTTDVGYLLAEVDGLTQALAAVRTEVERLTKDRDAGVLREIALYEQMPTDAERAILHAARVGEAGDGR